MCIRDSLRLEKIQECGYDEAGNTARCLRPLELTWVTVTGGASNFPIAVKTLKDGLGAITHYYYATITPFTAVESAHRAPTERSISTTPTGFA